MIDELMIQKINKMPILLQKEVDDFIDFLIAKHQKNTTTTSESLENLRPIGTLKGLIIHVSDDFDEPLEEFKDYI